MGLQLSGPILLHHKEQECPPQSLITEILLWPSATRQAPEFPELLPYTYIGKNFESPEINAERSIRIYMFLCGWKDGSMTDVQVKKTILDGLGKEAIRC
jgi:hypothetical protein